MFGSSWHWIDPGRGTARAAELLRPGGTLARFWSFDVLDDDVLAELDAVYAAHVPGIGSYGRGRGRIESPWPDPVRSSHSFGPVEARTYRWQRTFDADTWVALTATLSDHQVLEPSRLAALQAGLGDAIRARGGSVRSRGETYALLARRA